MVDKTLSANHIIPATRFLPSGYNTPSSGPSSGSLCVCEGNLSVHIAGDYAANVMNIFYNPQEYSEIFLFLSAMKNPANVSASAGNILKNCQTLSCVAVVQRHCGPMKQLISRWPERWLTIQRR